MDIFLVRISSWIFFELDQFRVSGRVRIPSWIFELGMISSLHIVLSGITECIGVILVMDIIFYSHTHVLEQGSDFAPVQPSQITVTSCTPKQAL